MKKTKRILLGVIIAVLLAVLGICIWQWENINAFLLYTKYSEEELASVLQEKRDQATQVLEKYEGITAIDLTVEQEEALIDGKISADEIIAELNTTKSESENIEKSAEGKSDSDIAAKESEIINRYLYRIYEIKAEFLGKLSVIKDDAVKAYIALPKDKRTRESKLGIVADRILECYELENSCDIEIEKVLTSLKAELMGIGADTSIVSEIREAYKNEKSTKKAYYLSKLS